MLTTDGRRIERQKRTGFNSYLLDQKLLEEEAELMGCYDPDISTIPPEVSIAGATKQIKGKRPIHRSWGLGGNQQTRMKNGSLSET